MIAKIYICPTWWRKNRYPENEGTPVRGNILGINEEDDTERDSFPEISMESEEKILGDSSLNFQYSKKNTKRKNRVHWL